MASINQIQLTIGGPEITPGTAVTRQYVIPVRAVATLDKVVEGAIDPAILGNNMDSGEYLVADSVEGGIPLTPRPTGGMGQLIKSILAQEVTPAEVGALIRFKYTGASASNKVVTDNTGNTITSSIGVLGSEVVDTNFGATGVIDCDDVGFDTVDEIVTAIDGYTDYSCEKVFEESAGYDTATNKVLTFTNKQGKNTWVYVWFGSTTSGVYLHEIYYDPTDTAEHPTYSIQKDGYEDNFLYDGCVANTLRFSAALKGFVEADMDFMGFSEATGQTASVLALEDRDPLIFYKGSFNIGENDYTYVRNISTDISQNHNADGYGQGSISRLYHQKGKCDVTGEATLRLDATSLLERSKMLNNTAVSVSYYFKGKNYGTTTVPELMLIEKPYCFINAYEFTENAGVFDARIAYRATYPKGTVYNNPITISLLTTDSGTY